MFYLKFQPKKYLTNLYAKNYEHKLSIEDLIFDDKNNIIHSLSSNSKVDVVKPVVIKIWLN